MQIQENALKPHVLALPLPFQGHINPMMQLCKRLVSRGLKVTMITMVTVASGWAENRLNGVKVEFIKEEVVDTNGLDAGFAFLERFHVTMTKNLATFLDKKRSSGDTVSVILYDSLIPWALDHIQKLGLPAGVFFTQACAVANIYNHIFRGTLTIPLHEINISLPSMPEMEANDLPSFLSDPGAYPQYLDTVLSQNKSLEKADWILFNTFDDLESEVLSWMRKFYRIMTVGPTIPSIYLDNRLKEDEAYCFNVFQSPAERCIKWLDTKHIASVVYVSFGSLSDLQQHQMEEISEGILRSDFNFLWVVRASEQGKLPSSLMSDIKEKGLIVEWCPQLEVLAHKAVGCFLTHCGWNSTIEAISLGVPVVALPLWIDQPTDAKYIADVWKAGSQVKAGNKGDVSQEDVESTIREVMHGEKANEIKKNALKFKEMAMKAMSKGGSSDMCIEEFVGDVINLG